MEDTVHQGREDSKVRPAGSKEPLEVPLEQEQGAGLEQWLEQDLSAPHCLLPSGAC